MRVSALFKHVCPIHLQFRVIWNVKTSDRKVAYFWMEHKWFLFYLYTYYHSF